MSAITRDGYYVIHTKMPSGFEFKIPARGYNLKSWLDFEARLECECYYEQTSQAVYDHLIMGDPSCPLSSAVDTPNPTPKKATRSSPKEKPVASKAIKKPSSTKPSAKTVKKPTVKKASSSPAKKKATAGSRKKVLDK